MLLCCVVFCYGVSCCAVLRFVVLYCIVLSYFLSCAVLFLCYDKSTFSSPLQKTLPDTLICKPSFLSAVHVVVPLIIVSVVVVVLITVIAKCRGGPNASHPRQTGQRSQQRRRLQSSTDATIVVQPVRTNARSSPLHSSNTNGVNTVRETPTLDSRMAPPIQFPVDSNLFSRAPPSYEDATAHVPLPTYEQAVGKPVWHEMRHKRSEHARCK